MPLLVLSSLSAIRYVYCSRRDGKILLWIFQCIVLLETQYIWLIRWDRWTYLGCTVNYKRTGRTRALFSKPYYLVRKFTYDIKLLITAVVLSSACTYVYMYAVAKRRLFELSSPSGRWIWCLQRRHTIQCTPRPFNSIPRHLYNSWRWEYRFRSIHVWWYARCTCSVCKTISQYNDLLGITHV